MISKAIKKLILLCIFGILIISGAIFVIVNNKQKETSLTSNTAPKDLVSEKKETEGDTPPSTYPEDFASGKQVIWYDDKGIYKYEGNAEKPKALTTFPEYTNGDNPILSPDNQKILYCISKNCSNQDIEKNLWIYDISKDKQTKLLPERKIIPNSYAWTEDSQSIIYTLRKSEGDKLYRVALNGAITPLGTNYSGNAYWPKPIGERYIAFTQEQYCDDKFIDDGPKSYPCHTGILDLQTNEVFIQNTLGDDNKIIKKIDQNTIIRIVKSLGRLENVKKDANKLILGLEKISLTNKKIDSIPLPATFSQEVNQRMIVDGLCGNKAILQQLTEENIKNYFGPGGYDFKYFIYDLEDKSLKEFDNKYSPFFCSLDLKNNNVYGQYNGLNIHEANLSTMRESKELNYSKLLFTPEMLTEYNKVKKGRCLTATTLAINSSNDSDFVYIHVGSNRYTEGGIPNCNEEVVSSSVGIYRLSISENTVTKITPYHPDRDYDNFYHLRILTPNL